jgi:tRNA-2-methylthio-N6-dimethylallyladenosine synthase
MVRYHIWTIGCQMNKADSDKLAAGLERLGLEEAASPDEADLVVLNTCSVRQHAEDRAISKLGVLRKLKSRRNLTIAVTGCMVGPRTDDLRRRFPYVDVFTRPQEFDPILEAIGIDGQDLGSEFWPRTFAITGSPTAYVPVVHGCDKFCSFCIVPYRRGRQRSRPIAEVREEVEHLVARGVREVTLLGQTVDAYGHDLPDRQAGLPATRAGLPDRPDLGDLLRDLHEIDGLYRLRFLTSYPRDMTERILRAVAGLPKVCQHFSLPVQSGDDGVLERMRRAYTVADYRQKLSLLRQLMPEAAVSTDVIVGFCGETEAEFRRTYDLLADLRFDKVHVAAYSPRPGTIAWRRLPDDVPREVKRERLRAVEELQARIAGEINSALLGRTVEVLVEEEKGRKLSGPARPPGGPARPPPKADPPPAELAGRTRSGKLVHFSGGASPGDLVRVVVEKTSPWSLQGRLAGAATARKSGDQPAPEQPAGLAAL